MVMVALAAGVAALALAACGGGGSGDNGNATAATGNGSGLVSMRSVDGTGVLADSRGRTLYSAAVEDGGQIHCTNACTSFWVPVGASANEARTAAADLDLHLGVVKRPGGGGRQLTLDGRPLYTFKEEGPGQLDGDGFVDDFAGTHFEWEAAKTGGGSGSPSSNSSSNSSPY